MSHNLYFSTDLFQVLCVCRLYNRLIYFATKTVLLWKQTSHHVWNGDFDCINLTVKFLNLPCDAWRNQKNPVTVLRELNGRSADMRLFSCLKKMSVHILILKCLYFVLVLLLFTWFAGGEGQQYRKIDQQTEDLVPGPGKWVYSWRSLVTPKQHDLFQTWVCCSTPGSLSHTLH